MIWKPSGSSEAHLHEAVDAAGDEGGAVGRERRSLGVRGLAEGHREGAGGGVELDFVALPPRRAVQQVEARALRQRAQVLLPAVQTRFTVLTTERRALSGQDKTARAENSLQGCGQLGQPNL